MATWKKIIVSGSEAELQSVLVDNLLQVSTNQIISSSAEDTRLSGSFTGSFVGDGSGLTGLVTTLTGSTDSGDFEVDLLTQNLTVQGTNSEIEVSGSGQTITIGLPNDVTVAGNLTVNGEGATVTGDLEVNGGDINSSATTFNLLNSTVSTINFGGAATTVNIGATTSTTTIKDNLVVDGDLTVQGDVTTLNTTNLLVEDRYILLNSGSVGGVNKGGIIVDGGSGTGKAFILGEASGRWGFTGSLAQDASTATPDAFAAAVVTSDIVEYQQVGNIRISGEDIFIYS